MDCWKNIQFVCPMIVDRSPCTCWKPLQSPIKNGGMMAIKD